MFSGKMKGDQVLQAGGIVRRWRLCLDGIVVSESYVSEKYEAWGLTSAEKIRLLL